MPESDIPRYERSVTPSDPTFPDQNRGRAPRPIGGHPHTRPSDPKNGDTGVGVTENGVTPTDPRYTVLVCTSCDGRIIYADPVNGLDPAEAERKWTAHNLLHIQAADGAA